MICKIELGELDRHYEDFTTRGVRIFAIANDDLTTTQRSQSEFKHLKFVSDADQNLAKAVKCVHAGMGPGGTDTSAPTTFLLDDKGNVRWIFRADRFTTRLPAEALLAAIDKHLPK